MLTALQWLGQKKDGIGIAIALTLLLVGGFQYFDSVVESRIEKGLDVLKRRESDTFVDARTILISKWVENQQLREEFARTSVYTPELIRSATAAIFDDPEYRTALINMSTYYSNAAACTMDGICDAPLMCASLMGEIQDFLDVNRGYIVATKSVRFEDANTIILSMPEFVEYCDRNIFINVASRHDYSVACRIGRYFDRLVGTSFGLSCEFKSTAYVDQVDHEAEKLRNLLTRSPAVNE